MTTAAEVKTMVQPLLARNPDLVFAGRMLFVRPVTHIVRVIEIARNTGRHAFTPFWGSTFMFFPPTPRSLGGNPCCGMMLGIWNLTHPQHQQALIETVETVALPALRKMHTIDDFLAFTNRDRFVVRWDATALPRLVVCAAMGDLERAKEASEYLKMYQAQ